MSPPAARVDDHPVLGPARERAAVTFTFDGRRLEAGAGDNLVAALLAHGIRELRTTSRGGAPRGLYCGIGHCYECQVSIAGRGVARACLTTVYDGMEVTSLAAGESPVTTGSGA
jgi:sarcosine oxidase subunit alpha